MTELNQVPEKQAYEWIRTTFWSKNQFSCWLDANNFSKVTRIGESGFYKPSYSLVYEWVGSKYWCRRQFKNWLNSCI